MTEQIYEKLLTANDTGETGGHQAGIHIPKSQSDLIRFLPALKPDVKNPDAWLNCIDDSGVEWSLFITTTNFTTLLERGTSTALHI